MRSGRSRRTAGHDARGIWDGRRFTIPYPWVAGEAHLVKLLTSTGTTFEHEIAVAVETPEGRSGEPRALRADRSLRRRDSGGARAALVSARLAARSHRPRRAARAHHRPARVSVRRCGRRRGWRLPRRCPARIRAWRCSSAAGARRVSRARDVRRMAAERARKRTTPAGDSGAVLALLVAVASACTTSARGWRSARRSRSAKRRSARC